MSQAAAMIAALRLAEAALVPELEAIVQCNSTDMDWRDGQLMPDSMDPDVIETIQPIVDALAAIRAVLAGSPAAVGWSLMPRELDADMRRAIWTAWAERAIHTVALRPQAVEARMASQWQAEADAAQWRALHAEAGRRLGNG